VTAGLTEPEAAPAAESREARTVSDAYGIALTLLLVSTFAIIAGRARLGSPYAVFALLLQFVALGVTIRVSGVNRNEFRGAAAIALLVAIVSQAAIMLGGGTGEVIGIVLWLLLTLFTVFSIFRRLRSYRVVNLSLVLGLLSVYVLLGLAFSLGYLIAWHFEPGSFGSAVRGMSDTTYFSFITLATVGYGDIAPIGSAVRALAVAEAITGQLYLVSVVSLAVSRLGDKSGRSRV
jgi:hypothetical protein